MTAEALEFEEDRVPFSGIEDAIEELVDIYGGEIKSSRDNLRQFILPLRRGVATAGAVECTLTWMADDGHDATVKVVCDRDIDAPKYQRVAILAVGVIGALLFTIWPFFMHRKEMGALAFMGAAVAIAVYFLTLRKTSGGIAFDFLQRLARHQRAAATADQ